MERLIENETFSGTDIVTIETIWSNIFVSFMVLGSVLFHVVMSGLKSN